MTRARGVVVAVCVGIVGWLIYGNLALIGASLGARVLTDVHTVPGVPGVRHLVEVDSKVWRGGPPDRQGYRALADHDVTTIVDLRPDDPTPRERAITRDLGIRLLHFPLRDGQSPSAEMVRRFIRVVRTNDGRVFVHCSEGVGRTGSMASAYEVTTGESDAPAAVRESLAVGVLTLEQIAYIASLERGGVHDPPLPAVAVSRFLDAPRQLFNSLV